jgi:ribosomal protein S18 acetylase RimI-like enzyme
LIFSEITYRVDTSSYKEILRHFNEADSSFIPPLSNSVSLKEYALKLSNKSTRYECWHKKKLVGLVAVYFNNEENSGYITNVSILEEFSGMKIASSLLKSILIFSKDKGLLKINLHVHQDNMRAIKFYESMGFKSILLNESKILMSHIIQVTE